MSNRILQKLNQHGNKLFPSIAGANIRISSIVYESQMAMTQPSLGEGYDIGAGSAGCKSNYLPYRGREDSDNRSLFLGGFYLSPLRERSRETHHRQYIEKK